MVIKVVPDEELMKVMEKARGKGRDGYPIMATWNSILAGIVYQHPSIESLRRELSRNGELRCVCRFDPMLGARAVPTPRAYSDFLRKIIIHREIISGMFNKLIQTKKVSCHCEGVTRSNLKEEGLLRFARNDIVFNAFVLVEDIKEILPEYGTVWEKVVKWFGYKIHLLADTKYELPIAYKVTRASENDSPKLKEMLEKTEED